MITTTNDTTYIIRFVKFLVEIFKRVRCTKNRKMEAVTPMTSNVEYIHHIIDRKKEDEMDKR